MSLEGMEEGAGENSCPPHSAPAAATTASSGSVGGGGEGDGVGDICGAVFERLVADNNEEALSNPGFRAQLEAHFSRFPQRNEESFCGNGCNFYLLKRKRYQLDMNVDKAADVLIHQKVLAEAKSSNRRIAFHVRFLRLEGIELDPANNSAAVKEGVDVGDDLSARQDRSYMHIHEIVFSTVDKRKLLSQLSALLSDIGLNIREAHVLSTTDGYSLDVFVVDGWPTKGTDSLHKELKTSILRNEASLSEISKRHLVMGDKIDSGSSAELFRGTYLDEDVAVKVLKVEELNDKVWYEFIQEVNILREVDHTNIVRFIGACTMPPQFFIVTEHMSGGSLYHFLRKQSDVLELPTLLKFALDICRGMSYLHQKGIIHRDLKTLNLLVGKDQVVKVADFGLARFQDGGVMTPETGTYKWMAPEVLKHEPYDKKVDVYSFAIVLWELMTSKVPFDSMTALQAAVAVYKGLRPSIPENGHPRLLALMQKCWETDPSDRPSFPDITAEIEDLLAQFEGTSGETSQRPKDDDSGTKD